MSEPVQIGIKEVYDAVTKLDGRLDDFIGEQRVTVALLKQDVDNLKQERSRKWQMNVAQAGWLVSLIIAVGGWVVRT